MAFGWARTLKNVRFWFNSHAQHRAELQAHSCYASLHFCNPLSEHQLYRLIKLPASVVKNFFLFIRCTLLLCIWYITWGYCECRLHSICIRIKWYKDDLVWIPLPLFDMYKFILYTFYRVFVMIFETSTIKIYNKNSQKYFF